MAQKGKVLTCVTKFDITVQHRLRGQMFYISNIISMNWTEHFNNLIDRYFHKSSVAICWPELGLQISWNPGPSIKKNYFPKLRNVPTATKNRRVFTKQEQNLFMPEIVENFQNTNFVKIPIQNEDQIIGRTIT